MKYKGFNYYIHHDVNYFRKYNYFLSYMRVTFRIKLLLEFAVSNLSAALKCDIDLLQIVQHRATTLIPSLRILNNEERLKALDLTTLSERRQRGDTIQIFKIFHGIDKIEMNNNFSFHRKLF